MNRSDVLLASLGGAGGRLADTITAVNDRFQTYYINTSITDLESLEFYNPVTRNFYCMGSVNGVGRNRVLGKEIAKQNASILLDALERHHQSVIYLIASLSGGSGSSTLSILLRALQMSPIDKVVNIICILPDKTSDDVLLRNAIETWNEIIDSPCYNSIIFIDNSCPAFQGMNPNDRELMINQQFAEQFDSLFDIPEVNGIQFDAGNLANALTERGCFYFYDLGEFQTIEAALDHMGQNSVLAPMTVVEEDYSILADGSRAVKCKRLSLSFANQNYNTNVVYRAFASEKEVYVGTNASSNLMLLSGCRPPQGTINELLAELRRREQQHQSNTFSFGSMAIPGFTSQPEYKAPAVSVQADKIAGKVVRKKRNHLFR